MLSDYDIRSFRTAVALFIHRTRSLTGGLSFCWMMWHDRADWHLVLQRCSRSWCDATLIMVCHIKSVNHSLHVAATFDVTLKHVMLPPCLWLPQLGSWVGRKRICPHPHVGRFQRRVPRVHCECDNPAAFFFLFNFFLCALHACLPVSRPEVACSST